MEQQFGKTLGDALELNEVDALGNILGNFGFSNANVLGDTLGDSYIDTVGVAYGE